MSRECIEKWFCDCCAAEIRDPEKSKDRIYIRTRDEHTIYVNVGTKTVSEDEFVFCNVECMSVYFKKVGG